MCIGRHRSLLQQRILYAIGSRLAAAVARPAETRTTAAVVATSMMISAKKNLSTDGRMGDEEAQQMTHYQSAIQHLNSLQSNAMVLQKLREKREFMQEMNIAETTAHLIRSGLQLSDLDRLNVIHVSGTKGKGSTCAFVESMLRSLGFKTGLYTSPHLVHARERIRINFDPIDEELFAHHFFQVYNKLKESEEQAPLPAYFKFLTLMAFHVFLAEKVDVAVVEVGIGGEHDCTNVIRKPLVCGVSTLDIDHTSILGTVISDIAWHKAGIFKPSVPAVATPPAPSGLRVFEERAEERQAPLSLAPPFSAYSWPSSDVHLGIKGSHQQLNVSLALQLVRVWLRRTGNEERVFPDASENKWQPGEPFDVPQQLVDAISECRWPGRSHIMVKGTKTFYLDGAHTPKSMEMCSIWFRSELPSSKKTKKRVLIFQCTADRNPSSLLPYLKDLDFDLALFCPTILHPVQDRKSDLTNFNQSTTDQTARSRECADVWKGLTNGEAKVFDCISSLVSWLQQNVSSPSDVLVTGSLHLVGGVLSFIDPK